MKHIGSRVKYNIPYTMPVTMKPSFNSSEDFDVIRGDWVVYTGNKERANDIFRAFLKVGVHGSKGYETPLRSGNRLYGRKVG